MVYFIVTVVIEYTTNIEHLAAILGIAAFVHVDDIIIDKIKEYRKHKAQHPVGLARHHNRHRGR